MLYYDEKIKLFFKLFNTLLKLYIQIDFDVKKCNVNTF